MRLRVAMSIIFNQTGKTDRLTEGVRAMGEAASDDWSPGLIMPICMSGEPIPICMPESIVIWVRGLITCTTTLLN